MVGSGGDEPSGFDSAFALDGIETDEVEGDVFEQGQVMSGVFAAGAHLVVVEDHVHDPVQAVLHRPVGDRRARQSFRI